MKVAVGLFYLESNTFNKNLVKKENFVFAEGGDMKKYIHVCDIFENAGFEVLPTIMASTLPAGKLKEEDYFYFANKILATIENEKELQGVWLHLHGSMEVENVGSGDLRLLKDIRNIIGDKIPISITLDAHANNDENLSEYVNIIRGYHTIPHKDQSEAERVSAFGLLELIKAKELVKPELKTIAAVISGEKGLGEKEPLKSIYKKIEEIEKMKEIMSATMFMGDPWSDCENSHLSVVVVPSKKEYQNVAKLMCENLYDMVFANLTNFDFEVPTLYPPEALKLALDFKESPVFISDSGDNTTGGGVGLGTEMLRLILETKDLKNKKILITAICETKAYQYLNALENGKSFSINFGENIDETSIAVQIEGVVVSKGKVLGYLNCDGDECGSSILLTLKNGVDLIVSNTATSFITPKHFEAANAPISNYDIIILKQGYLFSELREYSKFAVMAVTKGATYQYIEELPYKRLVRPIFPLDSIDDIKSK